MTKDTGVDLLQGTLDMLVLKAVLWGHCMAMESCCVSSRFLKTGWKFSRARCIPRCTGWSTKAGLQASGGRARTTGGRASIV